MAAPPAAVTEPKAASAAGDTEPSAVGEAGARPGYPSTGAVKPDARRESRPSAKPSAVRPMSSGSSPAKAAPAADTEHDESGADYATERDEPSDADRAVVAGFEPALTPYGVWRDHAVYGRVWVPRTTVVGSSFEPYVTAGRWALTSEGEWIWVSEYPFGDIVYHYGRWVWTPESSWLWIPGWRYAPAWVVWRVPHGHYAYVGWAPMPPSYIWLGTELVWLDVAPPAAFVFCYSSYVFRPHPYRHIVRDRIALRRMLRETTHYRPERPGAALQRSPSPSKALVPAWAVPRERVAARPSASVLGRAAGRASAVLARTAATGPARARPRSTSESSSPTEKSRHDSARARPSERPSARGEPPRGRDESLRPRGEPRRSRSSETSAQAAGRRAERHPSRPRPLGVVPRPRANPTTTTRTAPQRRAAQPRAVRGSR